MIIIKAGGGKSINWNYIAEDLATLTKREQVVLVHGAGATRDEIAEKMDAPTKTITSPSGITSVYTDKKALEIFLMVYAGLVNKTVVATLLRHGVNAVGITGVDGKLWQAKRKADVLVTEGSKTKLLRDNLTGRVEKVNTELIIHLLNGGYTPVIAPPAISYEGDIVNTDNDWAVAVMAGQLGVKKVVYLFEAPGLLRDVSDPASIISGVSRGQLDEYMQFAQGRMKKKILGAKKALESGVQTIYWGDGRIRNPIINALKGKGTIIS